MSELHVEIDLEVNTSGDMFFLVDGAFVFVRGYCSMSLLKTLSRRVRGDIYSLIGKHNIHEAIQSTMHHDHTLIGVFKATICYKDFEQDEGWNLMYKLDLISFDYASNNGEYVNIFKVGSAND